MSSSRQFKVKNIPVSKFEPYVPSYLKSYIQEEFKPSPALFSKYRCGANLAGLPINAWDLLPSLFKFNTKHIEKLRQESTYACPLSNNIYYGAYPVAYLSTRVPSLAEPANECEDWVKAEIQTTNLSDFTGEGIKYENEICKAFIGHGYDIRFLQYDAQPSRGYYIFKLNNNEKFIFSIWRETS